MRCLYIYARCYHCQPLSLRGTPYLDRAARGEVRTRFTLVVPCVLGSQTVQCNRALAHKQRGKEAVVVRDVVCAAVCEVELVGGVGYL